MAWTATNPVAIGDSTKKDHYDALWDNADYIYDLVVRGGSNGQVLVSNGSGVDADYEYKPLQNILTNSGFEVWSNSTLTQGTNVGRQTDFEVADAISNSDDSDFSSATGNWNLQASVTISGGLLQFAATGNKATLTAGMTTIVGHLYIGIAVCGTQTAGTMTLRSRDSAGTAIELITYTPVSGQPCSIIWTAQSTADQIELDGSGSTTTFTDVYVFEVTPGCVAADGLGPDGYDKGQVANQVWREPNGANTKEGSYYAGKVTFAGATYESFKWPLTSIWQTEEFLERLRGRTVTYGAWIKSDGATKLRLRDSDGSLYSDTHTGGDTYEWLEVTRTLGTSITEFRCGVYAEGTETAYISQPMLVFGSSIGEGNYSRPSGEYIVLEKRISSKLQATAYSSTSITAVDIQADTDGKLPANVKKVETQISIRDSGSGGTAECYVEFTPTASATDRPTYASCLGLFNNAYNRIQPIIYLFDGKYYYDIHASGAGTLDLTSFNYQAIVLE